MGMPFLEDALFGMALKGNHMQPTHFGYPILRQTLVSLWCSPPKKRDVLFRKAVEEHQVFLGLMPPNPSNLEGPMPRFEHF